MKKFLIILCILILGYIQIGYFIHLFALRLSARREIIQLLDCSVFDSSFYKFTSDDIKKDMQWEEEGKEFWFGGQLYDVVGQTIVNGKTYLYCFNDLKEKEIVINYMNNIRGRSDSSRQEQNLFSFFAQLFINSSIPSAYNIGFYKEIRFHSYSDTILHQYKEILSPPPEA